MDEHITSKTSLVIWSLVIFESVSVIKTYFMNQTIWKSHGHVKFKSSQSGLPIYHSCPSPPSNLNPPCLLSVQLYCPHSSSFANQIIQSVILCFNGLTKRKKIIPSGNFLCQELFGICISISFYLHTILHKKKITGCLVG